MHRIIPNLAIITMLFYAAVPLHSQDTVFKSGAATASLVELYSSEGCSSCPPAEALTNKLKDAPGLWKDLFPVVFHVDYWDNLGWADRFARSEYSQRQQNYAAHLGQNSVYTPEFIVNGLEWRRSWFSAQGFASTGAKKTGELSLTVRGRGGKISALYLPGSSDPKQPFVLNVALLGFNLITDVQRGENSGRRLDHEFVVLGFSSTRLNSATDKGFQSDPIELKSSTDDSPGAVVAWVTAADGSIVQIAGGWLKPSDSSASASTETGGTIPPSFR
jgi:hypothetical protein